MMIMIKSNCILRALLLLLLLVCGCSSFVHFAAGASRTSPPSIIMTTPSQHYGRQSSASHHVLNGAATVSAVESFFITQPYVAAFLTCSVKASAADWIAQSTIRQEDDTSSNDSCSVVVDVPRNFAFLLYGGLYQGMAQQFLYSTVFPDMFGHDLDLYGLASQVMFDMMCVGPCLCLPLCYAVKSLITAETKQVALQEGMSKYVHDVTTQGLLFKYWALWTPVNFLTFGIVPMHFRVAFVAFISFFWICILSSVAAAESSKE